MTGLLERQRVDRRTDPLGDLQWRSTEEELPDVVGRAVGGELFEVENLSEGQAHVTDEHHVHLEQRLRILARQYLDRPVVGTHRGHLTVVEPLAAVLAETRLAGHELGRGLLLEKEAPPPSTAEQ